MQTIRARFIYTVIALTFFGLLPVAAAAEPTVTKLCGGFKFTEGPTVDSIGNVLFTDIPNSKIHICWLTHDNNVTTYWTKAKRANGLHYVKDRGLFVCVGGEGKVIWITRDSDDETIVKVVADQYNGKPFNSPNDLWMDPKGGIYFTDPRYGGKRDNLPQDGEHVYYASPDFKKVTRVIDDMVRPNGLIGTPDGKRLYVADPGSKKTFVYTINSDATLSDKKLFAEQGSDGMTLDVLGNVYLTADAVDVYSPAGNKIRSIAIPERPSNVTYRRKDGRQWLYVTARTSLYEVAMPRTFHSFQAGDINSQLVDMLDYAGKVVLVVNVASQCGLTKQYAGLQKLYEKYKDRGLVVLGFPANNFGAQEPGTALEIKQFCTSKFGVTFPMFLKISVKGDDIHPLYAYLTSKEENGEFGGPIKWNFNKFLIGKDGRTLARFEPKLAPSDATVISAIEAALAQ